MKKIAIFLSILLFMGNLVSNAQTKTLTGTVTSAEDGSSIPGVSVSVKGTTLGTVTDIDGNYNLKAPGDASVLIFSFVGMATQEVSIDGRSSIDVQMENADITVDEVVVTALGIQREKKSLGFGATELGGDAVSEVKETNFVNSLSGKVAGVQIRQANTMGGSSNILIRGTTSLTGNNQALFVVDGVPIDNANTNTSNQTSGWGGYDYGNAAMDINPDDIESITVLKGAAASALYGSRAANGVVLVTTKKGKHKKGLGITINSQVQISKADKSTMPKHQKLYGGGYGPFYEDPTAYFFYADIDGDGVEDLITPTSEDASWGAAFDPNLMVIHWDALDPTSPKFGEKRPWVAPEHDYTYFFETGLKFSNNVSFEGAHDKGTFRLSYTNVDENGILPNSEIKKNTLSFAAVHNFTDKLSVDASITYVKTDAVGRYGTGYDEGNVMQSFGQWIETNVDFKRLKEDYISPDGRQRTWNYAYYDELVPIYFDNPYWVRYMNFQDDERNRFFGYAALNYKITDWLTFTGRTAIDYYTQIQNERVAVGSNGTSDFTKRTRTFNQRNTDVMLKFNKNINEFSINGIVGGNFYQSNIESTTGSTVGGLIVPGLYTISNSVSPVSVSESLQEKGMNSAYAQASVGYNNFVYLDVTGRYDVSSTLPDGNNAYFYPSVSGSLILSELGGMKDASWLNFGKFRMNYAEVGNDAPIYSTTSTYSQGTNWGDLALFSVNSTLQNPDLKPERTKSYEAGLEGRMFNDRFGFDISVYKSNSYDQIMPVLVSRSSGYTSRYVNSGEIQNKGIELSLDVTPVRTSDFSWDITLNWFKNKNEVISLYEGVSNLLLTSAWDVTINNTVGQPAGVIRGTDFVYTNGQPTVNENGYYMISDAEDEIIGNVNPDWNAGLINKFTYKNITLNVLLDMQQGGDIYSINTKYGQATGVYAETAGTNVLGNPMRDNVVSQSEGDMGAHFGGGVPLSDAASNSGGTILPGVKADGTPNDILINSGRWGRAFYYNNSPTARYVFDASYLKLREVSLAYTLPKAWFNNTPIQNLTLSAVGRNLWIISKNTEHFDPESGLSSGNKQGIESGAYPTARTFGFNVKIGF
ncbi:SusC/RagA family TonB-linked outer membrane protein [Draconibacterium sp. IB214405]|uniref:SusC/RagA family TonB-linked outer membrane protein n=1 Tax=Draconibacterium sp. IB214405 TaxID=3097352 RepID=UPI002A0EC12A|nr:SusC/RagA family TonB-linked outer membrane protein [Draconibacterium sp. IB214405]MDX8340834.1 SusC/RagA family TonB-linked outer membrane protein [Draconibacterium sp. IB214405]